MYWQTGLAHKIETAMSPPAPQAGEELLASKKYEEAAETLQKSLDFFNDDAVADEQILADRKVRHTATTAILGVFFSQAPSQTQTRMRHCAC